MNPDEIMALAKTWHDKAASLNSLSAAQQAVSDLSKCIYYLAKAATPKALKKPAKKPKRK